MGKNKTEGRSWTTKEEEIFDRFYKKIPMKELEKLLDRSSSSIYSHAYAIKKAAAKDTPEEKAGEITAYISFLKDLLKEKSKEIKETKEKIVKAEEVLNDMKGLI
jgi:hypothetical protein